MEAKAHYQILRALKRCFSRSDMHRNVLKKAKHETKKGPRGGARYECASCHRDFMLKDVQVDHIEPIIPLNKKGIELSWNFIINQIFCDEDNLQVLCHSCHKKKSNRENKKRKELRSSNKVKKNVKKKK